MPKWRIAGLTAFGRVVLYGIGVRVFRAPRGKPEHQQKDKYRASAQSAEQSASGGPAPAPQAGCAPRGPDPPASARAAPGRPPVAGAALLLRVRAPAAAQSPAADRR